MSDDQVVGIHPHKAAVLAATTRQALRELQTVGDALAGLLGDCGEDPGVLSPVVSAIDHLGQQATDLQRVIDEVWWLTAARADPEARLGLRVWDAQFDEAFVDPGAATSAALAAADAYRAGATGELAAAWSRWSSDPVFALVLLRAVGSGALVTQLRTMEGDMTPGPEDRDRRDRQAVVVERWASLYACATRFGVAPFTVDDLARDLVGHNGPIGDLALLVQGGAVFSRQTLLDLMRIVVLPLNAEIIAGRAITTSSGMPDGDTVVDPRALVFAALAKDPVAANQVVRQYGLEALIDERTPYLDDGAALGELLVAAARPVEDEHQQARQQQAAFSIIEWVAGRQRDADINGRLQRGTIDRLGRVAAPYVGSFRDPVYADSDPPAPLGVLGPITTAAFYDVVGRSAGAMLDLQAGALLWARAVFTGLSRRAIDDGDLPLVGNVLGLVSAARARTAITRAEDADTRAQNDRRLWKLLVGLAMGAITIPGGPVVDLLVTGIAVEGLSALIDHLSAPLEMTPDLARRTQRFVSEDEAMVLSLWLTALWGARADNHAFDGVAPPPAGLVAADGRLKTYVELSTADQRRFLTWIRDPAVAARTHWRVLGSEAGLAPGAGPG